VVNCTGAQVRLTGFGLASRLPRERQPPNPPESIAGTLAYMAPEQTGRMNRSIDSRSDLYSFGVTLYRMLTGALPFTASEPMEWVHCHIARKPLAPDERLENVPAPVSQIIMKLLAKTGEERFQTAVGVEKDLRHCLTEWECKGHIDPFPLGEHDAPDRLLIPERLYGRVCEVETLLASFDRVVKSGRPELVLVSGYSGIGKSSVVHELHRVLVPSRGLFAAGKFDQYKRGIPYATLAQAFQSLVRQLLSKSDAELGRWRDALTEALGPNGQLMINLIPELALIIGEQPPAPDVPPQDQQSRFQLVFGRFLGVFARPEHPLALFLDDLQWLDSATLDLIEHLVAHPDMHHLLLVGAYRNNEVGPAHPLARTLARLWEAEGRVQEVLLAPLMLTDVERLLADAMCTERRRVQPLAGLVFEKTGGNPFFTIQFLSTLAEEALLTFDPAMSAWTWNLPRIRAKGFTDNIAELMAAKLSRLPSETQKTLGQLACLGSEAESATLTLIHEASAEAIHAVLWDAARAGLVIRSENSYAFLHDRIREAAYALIADDERAMAHVRIGRLLAARTAPEQLEESIFDIVNQFERGAALITAEEEREQVAALNLMAGKRAKAATAYEVALQYFAAGRALLREHGWERHYRLTFDLELHWAECEYLTGQLSEAEERLAALSRRAQTNIDSAAAACVRLNLYTILDRSDKAVAVGLEYVGRIEPQWSPHPTAEDVRRECSRLWRRLESGSIEALLDLPMMSDPDQRATMNVLAALLSPAQFTDVNLFRLVIIRMAALSLEHGNTDGSCVAYALLGGVLGIYWGEPRAGLRVGRLALDLVEKRGFDRLNGAVYSVFALHVAHWTQHLATCKALLRRAFEAAREAGNLTFAAFARVDLVTNLLAIGESLEEVEREAESALVFVQSARFGLISDVITAQLKLIRTLRGKAPDLNSFNDAEFRDSAFEQHLESNPWLAIAASRYWIRKLQASVYTGNYAAAVRAASKVASLLWTLPTQLELPEYHFYAALAWAGYCDLTAEEGRPHNLQELRAHHEQIAGWAKSGPENFAHRAALLGAELARLEGRELDAERLYEQAIRSAREQGFVQNEGLAYELAARFYAVRGFEQIAHLYLRNARRCYLSWGAEGKVRQLDQLYPQLREEERAFGPMGTIGAPVEHLDLSTVIKVSQAVSGEIILDRLLDTIMRTAIEQAGAARGLLILARGVEHRIAVEATIYGDAVIVQLRDEAVTDVTLPASVLHYVLNTHESVVLEDAAAQNPFSTDPYVREHQARSILCLPLLNQAKLIGVLYLENNLTPRVFAPARVPVLKLLASQAAISLENTRLYRDLAEREAKIRRLVDANIIGIFFWDFEGRILEANEAFLRIVGYDREDLVAGRIRWTDLTPSDWQGEDARLVRQHKLTGLLQPFEKEYFRKDGGRVPVLIGVAPFEESGDQGVAFVVDLTERRRAEAEARENERRYREVQMQLAHANRVATMGQLTASIAHEVNQPIAAALTNAQAALRFLAMDSPELWEVQEALVSIVKDGRRASDIIDRMRALFKKAPPLQERLDINEALGEIVALTRGEAAKNGVLVRTQLAVGLPTVQGDRVQLQQVLLNLIINAIEAMNEVGEGARDLQISTGRDSANDLLVTVQDSGPGLTQAALANVFEPFYTTKPTGLGVGLSICRSIIEAHGGQLWASANVPRGAVFQFTLPLVKGS
jgi:PAS domain S-box-containing protein